MTPAQIRARIETASARLVRMQADLDRKETLYRTTGDVNGDGRVDANDLKALTKVRDRTSDAQNRIDGLLQQLIIAEAREEGTPVDEISFEDEAVLVEGSADRKPFEADRNLFKTKISLWGGKTRESLSRLVGTMKDTEAEGPSFARGDIVSLAAAALTASQPQLAAALGIANTLLNVAVVAYKKSLPPTPSLRVMETNWRAAIDAVDDTVANAAYDKIVQAFRESNGMDSDEEYIYSTFFSDWNALIGSFVEGKTLPSEKSIKAAFMAHIFAEMPDDDFWDMDLTSGTVDIYMEFNMDKNEFSFTSGSVDDVTTEVKQGLLAEPDLFGPGGVISLPTPITFKIYGVGEVTGKICEVVRSSSTSGNTGFQMSPMVLGTDATMEEQGTVFQMFMNRRVYSTVSVTQVLS